MQEFSLKYFSFPRGFYSSKFTKRHEYEIASIFLTVKQRSTLVHFHRHLKIENHFILTLDWLSLSDRLEHFRLGYVTLGFSNFQQN